MTKFRTYNAGLSRQLLQWFLLLSLLPLFIVSWLGYRGANDQLVHEAELWLADVSKVQTESIQVSFERMVVDTDEKANQLDNSKFLIALTAVWAANGKPLNQFVKSFRWAQVEDEHAGGLKTFLAAYGYHDIYLIDEGGNILFTFNREADLGLNLFEGDLAKTRFAAAAKESLRSGKVVFSDLEAYAVSNGALTGFLMAPLLDDAGLKVGLIALRLAPDQITSLVGKETGFGETGRRYMIGEDLALRTPGALGDGFQTLTHKVTTRLCENWKKRYVTESDAANIDQVVNNEVIEYLGPLGQEVLGVVRNIRMAGVAWGYVVEIDKTEALQGAISLRNKTIGLSAVTIILVMAVALFITRRITSPIVQIAGALTEVGEGGFTQEIRIAARNELGALAQGFNVMIQNLRESAVEAEAQTWLKDGSSRLNDQMQGDLILTELTRITIGFLCRYLEAQMGAFYIQDEQSIKLVASYAFSTRKGFRNEFQVGEGLVGQAALEQQTIVFSDAPDDYVAIGSGLGETRPRVITVIPLIWNKEVVALLEFASLTRFSPLQERLIENVASRIAIAIQTTLSRDLTRKLLAQTQVQAEELQTREEELRENNSLLKKQTDDLKKNGQALVEKQGELEEKNSLLQSQQEELRVANEELEEKARDLKDSRDVVETKNNDLEKARLALERKAGDLTVTSKYKSEFLANMSHELRTPLNSVLILARLLADNKEHNLTEKQMEYARTIHDSGSDLLALINDILDLSKIEAGKMDVQIETIYLEDFTDTLVRKFQPVATKKGLEFVIQAQGAPTNWRSDSQKLNQVIKNLLSNAFKFTQQGRVTLSIGPVTARTTLHRPDLSRKDAFSIVVSDTGIGIPAAQLNSIFEAFQQGDGTTSRKYGGTGLGLSISRELAKLLGGEIQLESVEGEGSVFSLFIPRALVITVAENKSEPPGEVKPVGVERVIREPLVRDEPVSIPEMSPQIPDDRHDLKPGDRSVLIIEDDFRFAGILADTARERGFKVLVVASGESGLHFADFYEPNAIILDIGLPGMDGLKVMTHLKSNAKTRHIPVHIMTARDGSLDALKKGAVGFLTKPISLEALAEAFSRIERIIDRPVKNLLLVEDDPVQQRSLVALIGNGDVKTAVASSGAEARQMLTEEHYDCIVLDLGLPDMSGVDLLESLRSHKNACEIPVVVYTGKDPTAEERTVLNRFAQSIIIKDVDSMERLFDNTSLFLHRVEANLPEASRCMIRMLHDKEALLEDRKVMIVDDDMRNVFALCAVLEEKKMPVVVAVNGQEALAKLNANPDMAIILMDIMMPEMDGYEAMTKIRAQPRFSDLPIIALTAKAMKGDRSKCIEAGASDYMAKPVETQKLLSMMRVWLYR